MSVFGPTLVPSFLSNDADFRTWVQAVHDKLAAVGVVQTADTGQITIGTAIKPVANTAAGYEVWRFADALQATMPVFIKIEYGVGSAVSVPSLWVTVGTGTNGAGTINAQATSRIVGAQAALDAAGATRNLEASGDTGRISLVASQNPAAVNYSFGLFVERLKDAGGNVVADGVFVGVLGSSGPTSCVIPQTAPVPVASSAAQPASPAIGGVSAVGPDVVVVPQLAYCGKVFYTWLGYMNSVDITGDTTLQAQMFGANHTFRTIRQNASGGIMTFLWE